MLMHREVAEKAVATLNATRPGMARVFAATDKGTMINWRADFISTPPLSTIYGGADLYEDGTVCVGFHGLSESELFRMPEKLRSGRVVYANPVDFMAGVIALANIIDHRDREARDDAAFRTMMTGGEIPETEERREYTIATFPVGRNSPVNDGPAELFPHLEVIHSGNPAVRDDGPVDWTALEPLLQAIHDAENLEALKTAVEAYDAWYERNHTLDDRVEPLQKALRRYSFRVPTFGGLAPDFPPFGMHAWSWDAERILWDDGGFVIRNRDD